MEHTSLELCPSEGTGRGEETPKKSKSKAKKAAEAVDAEAWSLDNYLDRHEDIHYSKLKLDSKQEQGQVCHSTTAHAVLDPNGHELATAYLQSVLKFVTPCEL